VAEKKLVKMNPPATVGEVMIISFMAI